jgi:hypothetical protein
MSEYLNPIAEQDKPDSGKIITPEDAHRIKETHSFFCPDFDCKDSARILIPAISVKGNYFFRHKPNCKHDIRPETLLHKSAIKWFEGKIEFEIPSAKTSRYRFNKQTLQLDPTKTECEYRKMQLMIPDVKCCSTNGFEFAIEIFVTSDVSADKKKLIDQFGLPVIRIDLSKFYKQDPHRCRVDLEFILENLPRLLTDISLKSWVIPPTQERIEGKLDWNVVEPEPVAPPVDQQPSGDNSGAGCVLGIITLGLAYLFFPRGRKKKRSGR